MSRRNWDKPRYRIRGKATESIFGTVGDIASLLPRAAPAKPRPSKQELRQEAERAFRQFTKRER